MTSFLAGGSLPTSLLDATGLYEIEWEGDWSSTYQRTITDSLGRIATQVDRLLAEIEKGTTRAVRMHAKRTRGTIECAETGLEGAEKGIASTSENLELYHYDYGGDADAITKSGGWWWDAQIIFNDGVKPPKWCDMAPRSFDELFFHELTHIYGTEDDDSEGDLMNAHTIDGMINGNVVGNPIYRHLKRLAREKCKCPDLAPRPQRPGVPPPFGNPWLY